MKNAVKISMMTATIAVAMMFFGGCKKETGTPSLESGKFNGKVNATNVDGAPSTIVGVAPWNLLDLNSQNGQFGDEVSFSNKRFTVDLPKTLPKNAKMYDIEKFFEEVFNVTGSLKYSDPKVKVASALFFAGTATHWVGHFYHATDDDKVICFFVYADEDVTVTGGSNISVKLEEGWNRVYFTDSGNKKDNKYSTKPVEGLKWFYEAF